MHAFKGHDRYCNRTGCLLKVEVSKIWELRKNRRESTIRDVSEAIQLDFSQRFCIVSDNRLYSVFIDLSQLFAERYFRPAQEVLLKPVRVRRMGKGRRRTEEITA